MKRKSILMSAATVMLSCTLAFSLSACQPRTQAAGQQASNQKSSSQNQDTNTNSTMLAQKLTAYEIDLQDSTKAFGSNTGIRKYLRNWASSRDIDCEVDASGNVIMTKASSKEYKEAPPTVIICPYDNEQGDEALSPIASALYIINNNENTGKLTVIFTQENGHQFTGTRKLDAQLFTDDSRVFYLNGTSKGQFSLKAAGSMLLKFSHRLSYTKPDYQLTYRISIKGLDRGQANSDLSDNTNAILRIKDLLNYMNNANIDYNLASIDGGSDDGLSPGDCTVTVTIDPNREQRFIDHMDAVTERFNADRSHEHPGATYLYTKTTTPEKVLDEESNETMMAFMYTLMNGMYRNNQMRLNEISGDPYTLNQVCYIHTGSSSVEINSVTNSLLDSDFKEVRENQGKLAKLTGMKMKVVSRSPIWEGNDKSDFSSDVAAAYKEYYNSSLKYSDSYASTGAQYIMRKNKKAQIVVLNMNDNVMEACTGTIIDYLINSVPGNEDSLLTR